MATVAMKHVYIYGLDTQLPRTLDEFCRLKCFHPDRAVQSGDGTGVKNPYRSLLHKTNGLLNDIGVSVDYDDYDDTHYDIDEIAELVNDTAGTVSELAQRRAELTDEIAEFDRAKIQLGHIINMGSNFDNIFKCSFVKVRFGRLPKDSLVKLEYFEDQPFTFQQYDFDGEYYWGVYFTDTPHSAVVDNIFNDLYFERIRVPDFAHGTPKDSLAIFDMYERSLKEELSGLPDIFGIEDAVVEKLKNYAKYLSYHERLYNLTGLATQLDYSFYLSGFIPEDRYGEAEQALKKIDSVHMIKQNTKNSEIAPPTKLKNNKFSRPFEFFVEMYGLPRAGGVDPTLFVALTYTLFFGIMFADVGQGLVLALIGLFITKKRKHALGGVMTRCGISSMIFGSVFGSVFGFEHVFDPFWQSLGLSGKPIHALSSEWAIVILLISVGIGVAMTVVVIVLSLVAAHKEGRLRHRLFTPNGISGMVFYVTGVFLLVDSLFLHTGVPLFITLPILLISFFAIAFAEPITHLYCGHKLSDLKFGDVVLAAFFETFETVLSYVSNTLSYMRVGGFVLVHAGMMTVVFVLAEMSPTFFIPVVIIGNIFVIALEGLIAGIQVMRLEYYEMFNRFYLAGGTPFSPLQIKSNDNK